jgi:hypothetical protein
VAHRVNEGFANAEALLHDSSAARLYDRNTREFSPAYYAYHVNQRPMPWFLRGHRFRLTGAERTGDIEAEDRFEKREV